MKQGTEKNNALTFVKVLTPLVMALLASDAWQYIKTPEKIEEVYSTSEPIRKTDSLRTDKQAKRVVNKILDNKLSELILSQGLKDKYQFTEKQSADLDNIIREVVDPENGYQKNKIVLAEIKAYLDTLKNKRYLCPVKYLNTGKLKVQGLNEDFKLEFGGKKEYAKKDKVLERPIYYYKDFEEEFTPVTYLRKPIFKK